MIIRNHIGRTFFNHTVTNTCMLYASSGRIPSLKGYVFYFNHLITRNHDIFQQISLFENIF
ncbi:MAG: hypothetical protein Q8834_02735, partial [Candidatus Phytoplasma australasiaticum]|nr:hypothetical protein [Candidatus Phytoplasma australasiaticum]